MGDEQKSNTRVVVPFIYFVKHETSNLITLATKIINLITLSLLQIINEHTRSLHRKL